MRLVATVNGVDVYSTKQIGQIINSKVFFTDGSWCDVATSEVVNDGPGSISLGAPSSKAGGSPKKVGPQTFQGVHFVEVSGISADVNVAVGVETSITIEGPEGEVDSISFSHVSDRLLIGSKSGGRKSGISGVNIFSGSDSITISGSVRGSHVIMGGPKRIIMSSNEGSSTKVTVTVPKGTGLSILDIDGNATIGDTEGPVQASTKGGGFTIGKVCDATLSVQGSGDIHVAEVTGDLSMSIQGSGDIRVKNGEVRNLAANVMGSGNARFGGNAMNASLSVMGSGDINIHRVTNRPRMSSMGSGDINVGNW